MNVDKNSTASAALGPVTLASASSPLGKFIGLIFFGLIWNGILSIFLFEVIQGFRHGKPEWFLTVFMIPFVLVGLGVILGVVYTGLALFNPRPVITMSSAATRLGEDLEIAWRFQGNVQVLQRLQIFWEAVEESQYRRGTSTYTDRSTFYRQVLFDSTDRRRFADGAIRATMPRDTMHSWDGGHNKIVWTFRLIGEIRRWPDVNESYPLQVWPLTLESIARAILDHPT